MITRFKKGDRVKGIVQPWIGSAGIVINTDRYEDDKLVQVLVTKSNSSFSIKNTKYYILSSQLAPEWTVRDIKNTING